MDIYFLYSIPQWVIFVSLVVIIYGWVEHKKVFGLLGSSFFILLALFSIFAISKGYFVFNNYLSPEEIISQEMEETGLDIPGLPVQARLLPIYWGLIISGALACITFFLEWNEKKNIKLFKILLGGFSIGLFFMILAVIKI